MRLLIADGRARWRELDRRIAGFDAELAAFTRENGASRTLAKIPGVGVMIASAMIATISKVETLQHGRDLSAWLGLVQRQSTTGGMPRLFGIGERSDKCPRKSLIHGAHAAFHASPNATRRRADGPRGCARARQNHKNDGVDAPPDGIAMCQGGDVSHPTNGEGIHGKG